MKNSKKQRIRKTFKTVVSGTVASSILVNSCTVPPINDSLYEKYVPQKDIGDELLPIAFHLKPDDAQYVMALQLLSLDILRDPSVAKAVITNPNEVLKKYGYDGIVCLDDSVVKIILALGDKEINKTVKDRDIHKFVDLCRQKGFLSDEIHSTLFSDEFYQEQITKLKQFVQTRSLDDDSRYEIFYLIGAVIIAIVGVAVIAGVEAIWNVRGVWNNYVKVNEFSDSQFSMHKIDISSENVSVIDIIPMILTDGYQIVDAFYADIVQTGLDFVREMYPEMLEIYTEEGIRQLLYINIKQNEN